MKLKLIELYFDTPLHLGTPREDYASSESTLHSDALSAAIIQAWAEMGLDKALDQIGAASDAFGHLPFVLSSMFPFTETNNKKRSKVYFFPRIRKAFNPRINARSDLYLHKKTIKDLQWMDLEYFDAHIHTAKGCLPDFNHIRGEYLSHERIDPTFISSEAQPRVTVSRMGLDSNPFYTERLFFSQGSGLFFLYAEEDDASWPLVQAALEFLSESGIGTDRNVGNGKFHFTVADEHPIIDKFQAWSLMPADHVTNLSLYNPSDSEIFQESLASPYVGYELIKRGGWISMPPFLSLRKRSVFMLGEGSIFHDPNQQLLPMEGAIVNIRPNTQEIGRPIPYGIWRSGKSLFVPVTFPSQASPA